MTSDRDLIIEELRKCGIAEQAGGIHVFKDHRPQGAVTPGSFGKMFVLRGWAADRV